MNQKRKERERIVCSGKTQYNPIQRPNEAAIIDPERWRKWVILKRCHAVVRPHLPGPRLILLPEVDF